MKKFEGYMHGINLGGWLSQCAEYSEAHYSSFIKKADIELIAEWKLDHVRLPVDYCVIEDENGLPVESGLRHIDDCISWCTENNLNVIIDLHKTKGFAFDDSVGGNTLWDNRSLQEGFISLWINLASRYHSCKNISFELLNEVADCNTEKWNCLVNEAVKEIRKFAPYTNIIIGGKQWNSVHTLKLLDVFNDGRIIYNFHFYEPFLFTHQRAPWQPAIPDEPIEYPGNIEDYRKRSNRINCFGSGLMNTDKMGPEFMEALIKEAVDAAENADVPLYCGEYGVIDRADTESTTKWYEDIRSIFEKYNIGRAAWTYKGMDFGITEDHYAPYAGKIIKLL